MIIDRIKAYIEYKDISVASFEKSVGMSNSAISKLIKNGGSIGGDKLENILTFYPDLSAEWLMRGEGDMLRNAAMMATMADMERLALGKVLAADLKTFIYQD